MQNKTIWLPAHYLEKGLENGGQKPTLSTYILENYPFDKERIRPIVIICPGGGFSHLSDREAEAVAVRMNSLGFHAAVLKYSLAPMDFPCAMLDLAAAVAIVRANSERWHIDSGRIICCGFSAGGHVCASLGCRWNTEIIQQYLPYTAEQVRPNALLLCYPVISAREGICHKDSVANALGKNCAGKFELFGLEDLVNSDVPPTFIWHSDEDEAVPAENSLLFANALRAAKIPLEFHLFSTGRHGIALATAETSGPEGTYINGQCAVWPDLFAAWARNLPQPQTIDKILP